MPITTSNSTRVNPRLRRMMPFSAAARVSISNRTLLRSTTKFTIGFVPTGAAPSVTVSTGVPRVASRAAAWNYVVYGGSWAMIPVKDYPGARRSFPWVMLAILALNVGVFAFELSLGGTQRDEI